MQYNQEIYYRFIEDFNVQVQKNIERKSNIVFLCIGTDRIIGDSFGPIVGNRLKRMFSNKKNIKVIGYVGKIVNAKNIRCIMKYIKEKYNNAFIIAIDSAISNKKNIGEIVVTNKGIKLGSGLNKEIIKVGDIGIKGVVAQDLKTPRQNFNILKNTSLKLILEMAEITSNGICNVINV